MIPKSWLCSPVHQQTDRVESQSHTTAKPQHSSAAQVVVPSTESQGDGREALGQKYLGLSNEQGMQNSEVRFKFYFDISEKKLHSVKEGQREWNKGLSPVKAMGYLQFTYVQHSVK